MGSDPSKGRGEVVWTPTEEAFASSRVAEFGRYCTGRTQRDLAAFPALLDWSIAEPEAFWGMFADWAGIRWHDAPSGVLADRTMPHARWFPGGTLNYAEQALTADGPGRRGADTAIVSLSQSRDRTTLTYDELARQVGRCATGLRRLGIRQGDRVAGLMPNISETIVAFLATASIGAIWSSCAPEFGTSAILDRWRQLEPTVLITIDGYRYGARVVSCASTVDSLVADLRTVRHVVSVPYLGAGADGGSRVGDDGGSTVAWADLCAESGDDASTFATVPFDHPLYVLFSSGTTGLPKAIVHCHGGMVVEHLKALVLHHDIRPSDVFLWFTTTGWMMWNYLVSGLLTGATVVLFDGDPGFPDLNTLWSVADDEGVTVLGVGAPFLMACRAEGIEPERDFELRRLRQVGSTGSPLPPEGYRWVRDHVGADVQLCSISGGTDVCTAFLGAAPVVPVRAGEISTRMLGCDVKAFDESGAECGPGATGELVIATPMPSMPTGFWGDASGQRFRSAYFEHFEGVWHHGDWICFDADGSCVITGRSDATLNRGGVRLGTAEFYSVIDAYPDVADSIVVHIEDPDGGPGVLLLLVATRSGDLLDDDARRDLAAQLRTRLSPRHVPDVIEQFRAIPRTLTGKRIEVPVKRLLTGGDPALVTSREALTDPAAFDEIASWAAAFGRETSG